MTASTFYAEGRRINYANTGSAITAGDIVSIAVGTTGNIGIAVTDIAATTGTGELDIKGVFACPKASGEAFTPRQVVYFNASDAMTGTSSSTYTRAGRVMAAAASAATTCYVDINAA
jgi:predicted RecA/RadA family phage recombinase